MADENVMSPSENYKTNEKKKEDSIGLGVYSLRVCGFDAGTSLWDNCNADWPGWASQGAPEKSTSRQDIAWKDAHNEGRRP